MRIWKLESCWKTAGAVFFLPLLFQLFMLGRGPHHQLFVGFDILCVENHISEPEVYENLHGQGSKMKALNKDEKELMESLKHLCAPMIFAGEKRGPAIGRDFFDALHSITVWGVARASAVRIANV